MNMEDEELCVAKSFSLKRSVISAIRARAAYLGIPMSAYVSRVLRRDLARGIQAPFTLGTSPEEEEPPGSQSVASQRGVVVPEFDLD
jgi:hypothetical protein